MANDFTQEQRIIAVNTPLGIDVLLLKSFTITQELGRPFVCECELRSTDHAIDFAKIIGEPAAIRLNLNPTGTRFINGVVSRFSSVGPPRSGRINSYSMTVVPALWYLTRTADCRIFQNKSIPDIIKAVLGDCEAIKFEDKLKATYSPREYVVQYRETAFNFISRLMEEEGIYYYFAHTKDSHTMILCDDPSTHTVPAGLTDVEFREQTDSKGGEHLWELTRSHTLMPGKFLLRDYDFKSPGKLLDSDRATDAQKHKQTKFEVFDYPGFYEDKGEGDRYVRVRTEESDAQFETINFEGDVRPLEPGAKFKLAKFPIAEHNKEYVVIASTCSANTDEWGTGKGGKPSAEEAYRVTGIMAAASSAFRSPRSTPRPCISGPQTAFVSGKDSDEILTDEFGRVKVRFLWDRSGSDADKSSCFVRVSQGWAGKKFGMFFLPRIGQEVIVEFLEGDPDRPLITGRVYNGGPDGQVPYKPTEFGTLSTIKSCTSKGGGGFNEIRFEDKKGEEQIFIHGENQLDIRIKKNTYEWNGGERHLIVEKDQFDKVGGARQSAVGGDELRSVGGDDHLKIKGKQNVEVGGALSLKVKGAVAEDFGGAHSEKCGGNYFLKAQGIVLEGPSGITLKCGGSSVVIDAAGVTIKGPMVTIDGQMTKINSGPGSPPVPGVPGSITAPKEPKAAEEADKADPGEVAKLKAEQQKTGKGKYGKTKIDPSGGGGGGSGGNPPPAKIFYEFKLVDDADQPVKTEKTKLTPTPGAPSEPTTNDSGIVKLEVDEGTDAKAGYPDRDDAEWDPDHEEEAT
jgi:type VI secretion system secreted protein VgrG